MNVEEAQVNIVLRGTVVHGKGEGHLHGMPTANLSPVPGTQLPPAGVYGGYAAVRSGRWLCLTNVGTRPSADNDPAVTVETLLLDFDEEIYGVEMALELHVFLRPVMRFAGGLDEVRQQLRLDEERLRALLPAPGGRQGTEPVELRSKVQVRLFASDDPEAAGFGQGIVTLLEGVEELGSINKATGRMGMAYSKAWHLLNRVEKEFGVTLVERSGPKGSRLTGDAVELLDRYRKTLQAAREAAEKALRE